MFGKKINRKSFAKAASKLSHDNHNEVIVYDPDTNEFSVSNRATANQIDEIIIMDGDTGYDPTDMAEKDFYDFFMSKAFDWREIELAVDEALEKYS